MANNDDFVEVAGRAGLLSRAALWLVTGTLALRLALAGNQQPGKEPDKQGALHTLARQPFGHALIVVLAVGFAAMVIWSLAEVVQQYDGERTGHWSKRVVAASRAVIYAALAFSTARFLVSHKSGSSKQEALTARLLGVTGGRLLVGAAALALLVAAGYNVYRAASRRYEKHWDKTRMDAHDRRIAGPAEAIGNVGHGLVFAVVGWFLGQAAIDADPSKPKSLDESLATLVHEPYGRPLCALVALGMVAWAVNALAQSRWRKIPASD